MSRKEQIIDAVAVGIYEGILSMGLPFCEAEKEARRINKSWEGWTLDLRYEDEEYFGDSWTRLNKVKLDDDDLDKAMRLAWSWKNG